MNDGDEVGSRAGRVQEILYPHIVLEEPWRREIITPMRNASLPAQIAETMWVLAGRDDVAWLQNYMPRAADYSDDGQVWRGAYGKRLRKWPLRNGIGVLDQLGWVVGLLKSDPITRRATMAIYDPDIDSTDGKDIPCNNWVHFLSRLGELHMHVTIRSNDLMWGWSGINAFEWSAVQEIVAGILGVSVGKLHFSISSLHLYDRHWSKAANIAKQPAAHDPFPAESPRFDAKVIGRDLWQFDQLVAEWFRLEEEVRTTRSLLTHEGVNNFPEPMLRSWLQVIAWWWSGDDSYLQSLQGTPLYIAAINSPPPVLVQPVKPVAVIERCPTCNSPTPRSHAAWAEKEVHTCPDPWHGGALVSAPFAEYVSTLHAEKHAVYGDSWKKRGEVLGILANIARKVDRLGEAGGGDTAADTGIDLLVYLIKYRLWLDIGGAVLDESLENQVYPVTDMLRSLPRTAGTTADVPRYINTLKGDFSELEEIVQRGGVSHTRITVVNHMIFGANLLARRLWENERVNA